MELENQEYTLCMLTTTRQTTLNLTPDLMHTVSEVNTWLLSKGVIFSFTHSHSFVILSRCLIRTADLLLIAKETGLNITEIQEALLNLTSITYLLRPGKI